MMQKGSLVVVGLGIKFKSHFTVEAETYIKQSDKVFYLINEPATKEWIKQNNPFSESLDEFYAKHPLRLRCYQAMTSYVLDAMRKGKHVCFVLYGHPTVFAKPALDAVRQAKKEGFVAKILPGISAEDCLFADLLINPGTSGCQSYEATDFLLYQRNVEPSSHLIIWQVGMLGVLGYPKAPPNIQALTLLIDYLRKYYSIDHNIILYEAAQYPHLEAKIVNLSLKDLLTASFSPLTTLYVPPLNKTALDLNALAILNINVEDLKINTD